MQWSKLNPYKTPIIAGSFALAFIVAVFSFFYGVSSSPNPPAPSNSNVVASATEQTKEIDLKIKGNKTSRIYHLPGCPNYNDIAERNIIWFKTHEEAKARRFRIAKNC